MSSANDSTAMEPGGIPQPTPLHTPYTISLGKNTTRSWGHTDPWPAGKTLAQVARMQGVMGKPASWLCVLRREGSARPYEVILRDRCGMKVGQTVLVDVAHAVQEVVSLYLGENNT